MTKYGWVGVALVCGFVTIAGSALANGRYPDATQLAVMPGNPDRLALRATYGFLFTSDRGGHWNWVCERAIGYGSMQEDPEIGITMSGSTVAATAEGLAVSTDQGCSWSLIGGGLLHQFVIDLVVQPDAPNTVLALTSMYTGASDAGGSSFYSQIFITTDGGVTWAPYGTAIDPSVLTQTIEVSASDPDRVYVSGVRGDSTTRTASMFVSTDDAMTWTEHPITPFNATIENGVFISAVDPKNPDRVYIRSADVLAGTVPTPPDTAPGRLFVTSDGGQTYTVAYSAKGPLFGFALSDDGSKVYLGGVTYPPDGGMPEGWIEVASSTDLSFKQTSNALALCLTYAGGTLYVCANTASGFIVGTSTDDGAHIAPLLPALCDIDGPLLCPADADASVSVCPAQWSGPLGLYQYTFQCTPDAGPSDDGGPSPPPIPPKSSGCGCRAAPATGTAIFGLVGVLGVLVLVARRSLCKSRRQVD